MTPVDLETCQATIEYLLGPGITYSTPQCRGTIASIVGLSDPGSTIGFTDGIILSTGAARDLFHDNQNDGFGCPNYLPGDASLDTINGGKPTLDATVVEFDFSTEGVCAGQAQVSVQYVLASDEYNEWVGSDSAPGYSDVFGFFLNGQNIATLPDGSGGSVSTATIHCGYYDDGKGKFRDCAPFGGPNCNLLRNNESAAADWANCLGEFTALPIEMDALTVVLTATGPVNTGPGVTNHIKLAIADEGDCKVDANVFIKAASFSCYEPRGACCDRAALSCVDNVLEWECAGEWQAIPCSTVHPPCRDARMLVLLDRTGSMNATLESGQTRCAEALLRARQDVLDFFANNANGEAAVWTFRDEGPTPLTNGFVDQAEATAALEAPGIEECGGLTPLAEAMCGAIDELVESITDPTNTDLILAVSSDGEENHSDGKADLEFPAERFRHIRGRARSATWPSATPSSRRGTGGPSAKKPGPLPTTLTLPSPLAREREPPAAGHATTHESRRLRGNRSLTVAAREGSAAAWEAGSGSISKRARRPARTPPTTCSFKTWHSRPTASSSSWRTTLRHRPARAATPFSVVETASPPTDARPPAANIAAMTRCASKSNRALSSRWWSQPLQRGDSYAPPCS